MKAKVVVGVALTATWFATPGFGDDKRPAIDDSRPHTRSSSADRNSRNHDFDQMSGVEKASEWIGTEVRNLRDEKLGKIDDLGISLESGRVALVVVSVGGLLGVGDTLVAVPPGALHHDTAKHVVHLDADKEKLKAAPQLELTKWDGCCDANRVGEVYRYYGQETFFLGGERSASSARRDSTPPGDNNAGTPGLTKPTQRADVTSRMALGPLSKASKVIGMAVRNNQDEKLGKVENLMVDLPANRLVAAVISSGGFLGIGDELSAVPPSSLKFSGDPDALILDATKESLGKAPHFKSSEWPAFDKPGYTESVYRAYNVEPYRNYRGSDGGRSAENDADNTRRNTRDRDDRTVTPLDQGNSTADVDTTARIRKEIVANKDLSINGRNVKIVTSNGRVTLRGVVNSEEERKQIANIARTMASPERVDDQLEVKSNK